MQMLHTRAGLGIKSLGVLSTSRGARRSITQTCARLSSSNFTENHSTSRLPQFDPSPSFKFIQPPHPSWQLGQGVVEDDALGKSWKNDEKQGWKTWVTEDTHEIEVYRLLTTAVIPRPIAFVSTISPDGIPNLAPMSYFSLVSHNPPLLSVSFFLSSRRPKDSRENILHTKEFTVSIISEPYAEAANACSVEAPARIDEWIVSGLTPEPSKHVKPPRVKESAVSLECELYDFKDISPSPSVEPTTTLVLGLIKQIHVRNAVLAEGGQTVDPSKLRPVARLGGNTYARLGEGFDLARPSWKHLKNTIEKITRLSNLRD